MQGVSEQLFCGAVCQRVLQCDIESVLHGMRCGAVPGCVRVADGLQGLHHDVWWRSVCCWQLHGHSHAELCFLSCWDVSGCGWRADCLQGVRGQQLSAVEWPDIVYWLYAELQCGGVP